MILSLLILIPLIGAGIALITRHARRVALLTGALLIALAAGLITRVLPMLSYTEHIGDLAMGGVSISLSLLADGLSASLVVLTALLSLYAVSIEDPHTRSRSYYALLLAIVACVMGVFLTTDLVILFLFWEAILALMFLLILGWGHANRRYAAMRFLVYTGIGSAGLLIALLITYATTSSFAFDAISGIPRVWGSAMFLALLFAFLVKMPAVPFHSWLPDAHTEAPTAGSVLLAGVLLKMGGYGLIRLGLEVPGHEMYTPLLFLLALITIFYGAWVCLTQTHLKRLIAYSSVNHMGIVLLGVAAGGALGITAAVFTMVSHGLISALLFGLAGHIHARTGTYDMTRLRGLAVSMPGVAWLLLIAALASLGLPSMTGFIAEFLTFLAAYGTFGLLGLIPIAGVLLTGGYIVRMVGMTVFGRPHAQPSRASSPLPHMLMLLIIIALGCMPLLLLSLIGP